MLKNLFCEDISVEYEFKSVKFKGVVDRLIMNNLDLSGNITEFKTLPTRPRSHRYILIYIFAMESVKICRLKTFWVRIFARGTLLLFRCFDIHVKMCVLLRYCVAQLPTLTNEKKNRNGANLQLRHALRAGGVIILVKCCKEVIVSLELVFFRIFRV